MWPNDLFSMGCPDCTNRENMLFVSDVAKSTKSKNDDFVLISPVNDKHVSSPRFTSPDGEILIYLENDIASTNSNISPGPSQKSRRLIRMNFTQSVAVAMSSDGMVYGSPYIYTVVDQVYEPVTEENGHEVFMGLYPITRRLPERVFSNDGDIVYLNIYQREALRIVGVDIFSGQVTLHPKKDLRVVDVLSKLLLIIRTGDVNRTPTAQIGMLVPPPTTTAQPTTTQTSTSAATVSTTVTSRDTTNMADTTFMTTSDTTSEMATSVSTSIAPTTTPTTIPYSSSSSTSPQTTASTTSAQKASEATTSSTSDPCEDLLQELEVADVSSSIRSRRQAVLDTPITDEATTLAISSATDESIDVVVKNATDDDLVVSTTSPHSMPLNLFYVQFHDVIPPFSTFDYKIEIIGIYEEEAVESTTTSGNEESDLEGSDNEDKSADEEESNTVDPYVESSNATESPTYITRISGVKNSMARLKLGDHASNGNQHLQGLNDLTSEGAVKDEDMRMLNMKSIYEVQYQDESYHAIFISPKFRENLLPLVVIIHDGPHEISTTCYSTKINSFLGMNMAVLSINYRGSIGTGDKNLESIMGFISEVNLKHNQQEYVRFSTLNLYFYEKRPVEFSLFLYFIRMMLMIVTTLCQRF